MKTTIENKHGEPVIMDATALTPIAFKHTFGADMLKDLNAIRKGDADETTLLELAGKMAFIMTATAENEKDFKKVMSLTLDDYYEFLNSFSSDYFQRGDVQFLIYGTWFNNAETIDKAKNLTSPPNVN